MQNQLFFLFTTCFLLLALHPVSGQGWQQTYGEGWAISAVQTADGGYIFTGYTLTPNDSTDIYLLKTDIEGHEMWSKTYGGPFEDLGWSVIPWDDGGYIVVATKESAPDNADIYVFKTDAFGELLWDTLYGGSSNELLRKGAATRTSDGGLAIVSLTLSNDGDITDTLQGGSDIWFLKLNAEGEKVWDRIFGGPADDDEGEVLRTSDDGFLIVAGRSCKTLFFSAGCEEYFLIRTDAEGNQLWAKGIIGGFDSGTPWGGGVATSDGGFIAAGWVDTNLVADTIKGGFVARFGLMKVDSLGNMLWFKQYPPPFSLPVEIIETDNNNLLVVFYAAEGDSVFIRLDSQGEYLSSHIIKSAFPIGLFDISPSSDGGFILAGFATDTFVTNKTYACLFKLDSLFNSFVNEIRGVVYWDTGDCLSDSTEQGLVQWLIKAENADHTFYAVTDTAGRFAMNVDTGLYALTVTLPNGFWLPCTDTVYVAFNQFYQTVDTSLGMSPTTLCPQLRVDIATHAVRRCFPNDYHVRYCNEGTATAENAYVEIDFDAFMDVDTTALPDPWVVLPDNAFRIQLGDVPAQACASFAITATPNCENTMLGENKCVAARIYPDSLCFSTQGWDRSNILVRWRCIGDTVVFIIINTGADMLAPGTFIVIEEVVLSFSPMIAQAYAVLFSGMFQLLAGQDTSIIVPAADSVTLRLQAFQSQGHPFSSSAWATAEGCPGFEPPSLFRQYPQDEASPFVAVECHEVVGPYDPNDKTPSPLGWGAEHLIRNNTLIEYHIRFQNTGTDTAFTVVVRDTLSPNLDLASVRPGASSHPYRFEMAPGRVLKFTFDNIMLPDSNVNEKASHGFIQFSVEQSDKPLNPVGTVIENKAAIYFDYNTPILTNTVLHTIGSLDTLLTEKRQICGPDVRDTVLTEYLTWVYLNLTRITFVEAAGFQEVFIDTVASIGDTIFNVVVIEPVTVVDTLKSDSGCDTLLYVHILIPTRSASDPLPFLLYPNPTGGDLTLFLPSGTREKVSFIEIRDLMGRLHRTYGAPAVNTLLLPVSELPHGVYFLTLNGPEGTSVRRFLKSE
ncbi:MAG: T9SS type A sorting domain-containing protein [Thermoanaerobaculia bacterium]|nr:T9SS type A sorting domain-containing protein [Thermoanaerobaculia bacterium]